MSRGNLLCACPLWEVVSAVQGKGDKVTGEMNHTIHFFLGNLVALILHSCAHPARDQGCQQSGDQGIRGVSDQGVRGSGDQGIRESGLHKIRGSGNQVSRKSGLSDGTDVGKLSFSSYQHNSRWEEEDKRGVEDIK